MQKIIKILKTILKVRMILKTNTSKCWIILKKREKMMKDKKDCNSLIKTDKLLCTPRSILIKNK